jgi:hypothetical protein
VLSYAGGPVLAFTQDLFRPCLHPVLTPAGHCVTAAHPADHPHHSGVWIGADRVTWCPTGGAGEAYTYNFYVDEVFQGRAPGSILETDSSSVGDAHGMRVVQELEWRGPREWGAASGRLVLAERRETRVELAAGAFLIDLFSELRAVAGAVELGPTRHAYFNVRVAEVMSLFGGGGVIDSRGRSGGEAIGAEGADWVCYRGPVGGGALASVAVLPAPGSGGGWFVADWGAVTVGPFRRQALRIEAEGTHRFGYRVVVSDGRAGDAELWSYHHAFAERCRERGFAVSGSEEG